MTAVSESGLPLLGLPSAGDRGAAEAIELAFPAALDRSYAVPFEASPVATTREAGAWGLLMIPILLCVAMLIFAVQTQSVPEPGPRTISTCVLADGPGLADEPC